MSVVSGDKHGVTLAMAVAALLASSRHARGLSRHTRWQLSTYTVWNLTLLTVRHLLRVPEWDPFLAVNSLSIWLGFRTAFTQGLDEHLRKKIAHLGVSLPRWQFLLGDHLMHTLPAILTITRLILERRRVPSITVTYGATFATWFAFCQGGKMDASDLYVPHPWKRAWFAATVGMLLTPRLVDAGIRRDWKKMAETLALLTVPYLSTRLDSGLRATYRLEYLLRTPLKEEDKPIPRAHSHPMLTSPQ